jgi:hypothetical protein
MEEFRVKLILGLGRNEDDLKIMGTFGLGRARDAFHFPIRDGANLEEKDVVWEAELVMGKGGGQGIFNSLLI